MTQVRVPAEVGPHIEMFDGETKAYDVGSDGTVAVDPADVERFLSAFAGSSVVDAADSTTAGNPSKASDKAPKEVPDANAPA